MSYLDNVIADSLYYWQTDPYRYIRQSAKLAKEVSDNAKQKEVAD